MNTIPRYRSLAERFPITHTVLDEQLGRYVLNLGSVTKFTDILHDHGAGENASFVIRWGRLDRENFQIRYVKASEIYGISLKLLRQKYELKDKSINLWRVEEKKGLDKQVQAVLQQKNTLVVNQVQNGDHQSKKEDQTGEHGKEAPRARHKM